MGEIEGAVMERLTEKIGNTNCVKGCGSNCKYGFQHCRTEDWENCKTIDDVIDKLAKYEDLEEQGRLIKLPCKEAYTKSGDIVYLIYDDEVVECTHCGLGINPVDGKAYITLATDEDIFPYRRPIPEYDLDPTDWCTNTIDAEVGEIGKTVFLTKSEAEQKLKEMEND